MDSEVFYLPYVFMYKNEFPLPSMTNETAMKELENLEVRDDDVFIVTYPKSGTHWMQEVVHLILVDGHAEKLSAEERRPVIELADVMSFDPQIVAAAGPVLRKFRNAQSPRVLSTHVQYPLLPRQLREKRTKMIYVYRHPKDVILSYYNFFLKFLKPDEKIPTFEEFFNAAVSGKFQHGSWFDHVLQYYEHEGEESSFAVSFEEMKQDLRQVVRDVANFLGRSLDDATIERVVKGASFETMKKSFLKDHDKNIAEGKDVVQPIVFLHKGKIGQWKESFSTEQNELIDQMFVDKMQDCKWTKAYSTDSVIE